MGFAMNEVNKQKNRLKHIREATEVNTIHKQDLARNSAERHERAKTQIKAELIDNRTIKYTSHMRWINR